AHHHARGVDAPLHRPDIAKFLTRGAGFDEHPVLSRACDPRAYLLHIARRKHEASALHRCADMDIERTARSDRRLEAARERPSFDPGGDQGGIGAVLVQWRPASSWIST